jgi:RHS repeat-associated protein
MQNLRTVINAKPSSHFSAFSNKCTKSKKLPLKSDTITYLFSFNGKEKIDEINGVGNDLDFGARVYDSRLGRWLSLDPLQAKYPNMSPYNYCANSPISLVDPDGKQNTIYLVILPDAMAKLTKCQVQDIIDKANLTYKELGLGTRVVLFEYKGPLPPDFNPKNLDETDAVAVIGATKQSVANYVNDHVEKGYVWQENKDLNGKRVKNQEHSPPGGLVVGIDLGDADLSKEDFNATLTANIAFSINHGSGHLSSGFNSLDYLDHNDGKIMTDGETLKLRIQDKNNLEFTCLNDLLSKKDNTNYIKFMKARFEKDGSEQIDNYEQNAGKNENNWSLK